MRNSMLIPSNVGCDVDINNHAYCILERIGRARFFGEATSGAFSMNDYVNDSKLLHYFRKTLLKNQLVTRQQVQTKMRGKRIIAQLFHLPRFHIIVPTASNMLMTEKLFEFLKQKPNHIADAEEVKAFMKFRQHKALVTFLKTRTNIFKYDLRCPYRELHPDATEDQYLLKNKGHRTVVTVKLVDPSIDIFQLWHTEDDDETHGDGEGFLDLSNQKLNRPLVHQVWQKMAETGKEGLSQHEVGKFFGLSKLNARSILRNMQRTRNIQFYMKDEGRQRVSK